MKNKKFKNIIIVIVSVLSVLTLKRFNDFRERNLDELIEYKPRDFYRLAFTFDGVTNDKMHSDWVSKDKKSVEELIQFLGQYRVKRINEEAFNNNRKLERTIEFTIIHSKANPTILYVYGDYIHIMAGKYYKLVNAPFDREWIEKYHNKYQLKNKN